MNIRETADFLEGRLEGGEDLEIHGVASIEKARKGEISFVENEKVFDKFQNTKASGLIVPENFSPQFPGALIKVKNPKLAFAKLAEKIRTVDTRAGWHETASIAAGADIRAKFIGAFVSIGENTSVAEDARIHDGVRIGRSVSIGKGSIIHSNCVIYDEVKIGQNCVIHAGTVIGADGFGYVRDIEREEHVKFPQIGRVVIENGVEIGANCCVDRGALGETRIGEGTKIDNLVQVAHNVSIGRRVLIASQTGISGSVTIEDDCVIAGQVGFGDHTWVKKGAVIGGKAGIFPGKIVREGVWGGIPVQPLDEYLRQIAHTKSLPRLKDEIKKLKTEKAFERKEFEKITEEFEKLSEEFKKLKEKFKNSE